MAQEQEQNSNDDFPDSSDNASFSAKENFLDSTSQEVQPESDAEKSDTKDSKFQPNIIVNVPRNSDVEARKLNKYTRIGLMVNSLLLLGTLAALFFTWRSIEYTKKSVDISQQALNDSRLKDSNAIIKQARIDFLDSLIRDRDYTRDTTNTALSKRSLNAQISTMQETQKQFEIDNMPYLQCNNFEFEELQSDKNIVIAFQAVNMGKQAARIEKTKYGYLAGPSIVVNPFQQFPDIAYDSKDAGVYVTKEFPDAEYFTSRETIPRTTLEAVLNGKFVFLFFGEITYKNEITKRTSVYSFTVRMFAPPIHQYNVIKNENRTID